jgi:hypothetical protein
VKLIEGGWTSRIELLECKFVVNVCSFGRRVRCKRHIKLQLKEIVCLGLNWINLARHGSGTGHFEYGNRLLGFIKHGKLQDLFFLVTSSSLLHAP